MTIETFDTTAFNAKMKIKYDGAIHEIAGVDFDEKMICFFENQEDGTPFPDLMIWAPVDECEIVCGKIY